MKKILIASGGTGGHIFPAIVFGKSLQEKGNTVSWLCGSRELEGAIYRSSGIEPVMLPLSGSPMGTRSVKKIFTRLLDVFRSISLTAKYIKSFKPDEIYLFGGYIICTADYCEGQGNSCNASRTERRCRASNPYGLKNGREDNYRLAGLQVDKGFRVHRDSSPRTREAS